MYFGWFVFIAYSSNTYGGGGGGGELINKNTIYF